MASLRDIRQKIGAVKKTQQITKAMNMVAASRLRGAQMRMEAFKPYATKFGEVLSGLAGRVEQERFALLRSRPEVKKVEILVLTADRGLCGSFNMNLINAAGRFIRELKAQDKEVSLVCVGKKGRDYFRRRGYNIRQAHVDVMGRFGYDLAASLGNDLSNSFISGEADEAYIVHSNFVSAARQRPICRRLLPISATDVQAKTGGTEYIFEPSVDVLLETLLPQNVNIQIYDGLLQTNVSEHASRMASMDNATRNCKDMINSLTLTFNKARQTTITKELMDIVGGAEALRG
ncbi:MAG: ATP synthase F1 subunit gamma [Pseudomonadota bacterium]